MPDLVKPVIVIPREQAVFRMDANGRWHNADGPFRKKAIIDFFHAAIGHDAEGYFVLQDKGEAVEKVYFPYADTALFVFDVVLGPDPELVLNTGARLALDPRSLFVSNDQLYLRRGTERIKFVERALMKIAAHIDADGDRLFFSMKGHRFPININGVDATDIEAPPNGTPFE